MAAMLHRLEVTPTIPVTAGILERHPKLLSDLEAVDLAVHGYRHVPYAALRIEEQESDLASAQEVFDRFGLPARGFRAPYLSANAATLDLLRARGFQFDSSSSYFALGPEHPISRVALPAATFRYGLLPTVPSVPVRLAGLVELPVALPDDEILVDSLGISNTEVLARTLLGMVDAAHATGSLLALQMHPERYRLIANALARAVVHARDLGAWCASLAEIAERVPPNGMAGDWRNGSPFALVVSGDLDAVTLGDYATRFWGR